MNVYLCGPMTGLTWADSNNWRKELVELVLAPITFYSPLRGKLSDDNEGDIIQHTYPNLMGNQKSIITRDRNDVNTADLLVANFLGSERVSIGSMFELAWADLQRVPVITIMETGNIHDHPFVREVSGWTVSSLEQAAFVLENVYVSKR